MFEERNLKDIFKKWNDLLGYKASVMRLFRMFDLFPLPIFIFPAGTKMEEIQHAINDEKLSNQKLAIRFSRPTNLPLDMQLNAPRTWLTVREDITEFIREHWSTNDDSLSSVVIQPKIDLQYSFELLHEENQITIEVLPGLWDIENPYPVDKIIINSETIEIFRYTKARKLRCSCRIC